MHSREIKADYASRVTTGACLPCCWSANKLLVLATQIGFMLEHFQLARKSVLGKCQASPDLACCNAADDDDSMSSRQASSQHASTSGRLPASAGPALQVQGACDLQGCPSGSAHGLAQTRLTLTSPPPHLFPNRGHASCCLKSIPCLAMRMCPDYSLLVQHFHTRVHGRLTNEEIAGQCAMMTSLLVQGQRQTRQAKSRKIRNPAKSRSPTAHLSDDEFTRLQALVQKLISAQAQVRHDCMLCIIQKVL